MSTSERFYLFVKSFRFRLFVIFTLGTALITIALTSTYILREKNEFRENTSERVRLLATVLAGNVRLPLFANDHAALLRLAEETAQQSDVAAVKISDGNGLIVAEIRRGNSNSGQIKETMEITSHAEREPLNLAMAENNSPISLGRVQVSLDTSRLDKSISRMTVSITLYSFIFWLVVSTFSYLALNRLTGSYRELMKGLSAMRTGNLAVRIPERGLDEPGQAARSVNELADALQQREEDNKQLQEKLVNAMRVHVQEEKRQVMAKLIQTNRMTSLGLLVSGMAHEINNPNGAIRLDGNFLGKMLHHMMPMLESAAGEDPDLRLSGLSFGDARKELYNALENIIHNTERIEAVIKDLRAYSLGANNPFTPDIDMNRVVTGANTVIRAHGQYTSTVLHMNLFPELPLISGSRHQLEQVVVNLLLNALQSLPPHGGEVTVRTAVDQETNEIIVGVTDTGEGIPPEHIARLYEPFFSTRIDSGGSGLGLYISNFIVCEHGGRLIFESRVGIGTTVVMRLPMPSSPHHANRELTNTPTRSSIF